MGYLRKGAIMNQSDNSFVAILGELVKSWHTSAATIPGYKHTLDDGSGITLMLQIRKTPEQGIELEVISVKDFISNISPTELLTIERLKGDDEIPAASVVIFP